MKENIHNKRILWVDAVKIFACFLVVAGHLYMSMMASGFFSEKEIFYCLPIQTVYTFHVPLFFVCSGYLYQLKKVEYTIQSHFADVKNKTLNLAVPYFVFSLITLLLKIVFSKEVNNQATPIVNTLFLNPTAPYWFLYALLFIFCLIPRFSKKRNIVIVFSLSILIRAVYIAFPELDSVLPFAVKTVILNSPWFLFGMVLTIVPNKNSNLMKVISLILLLIGIGVSAFFYQEENNSKAIQFGLGILFVISIIFLFKSIDWSKLDSVISKLSEYFMPVFLMHTIFAACMRTVLFKSGVQSLGIHIIVGFISSFVFPIITYEIAKKHWLLLFFIEPGKALKMRGKSKCLNTKD